MPLEAWQNGVAYAPGAIVTHQGKVYSKDADSDQTMPDDQKGGWSLLQDTNLQQYELIETSFNSYEQRVAAHQAAVAAAKASAEAKLQALGLTVEELQAIGL